MIRIRRPAILFAILSAIYWQLVAGFIGLINPLAGKDVAPFWMVALANIVPPTLYAVVTLIFCHWLARRVQRQAQQRSEP
ncbi:hypothetical protein M9978_01180 [Sphingomonas sp. MG17]|uniref:Uncharacterized protein n=1 Tax=Sphingomonas tagetis TaxID=2949092 RepID=A0A9X2HDC3_9SPHN|nr:hypothetical protein [Sphingomonas tagetis]MCP3729031.1 hypothetical protein [Sphingomonas tagetis]